MTKLNALDERTSIVHEVWSKPNRMRYGVTECSIEFSFPVYTEGWDSKCVFRGTNDPVTCLMCLTENG